MFLSNLSRKASGVMEYALVLAAVSVAVSGMFIYLKRGVQARVKDMTNGLVVKELYYDVDIENRTHQYLSGQSGSEAQTEYDSTSHQDTLGNSTTSTVSETTVSSFSEESVPEGWEAEL